MGIVLGRLRTERIRTQQPRQREAVWTETTDYRHDNAERSTIAVIAGGASGSDFRGALASGQEQRFKVHILFHQERQVTVVAHALKEEEIPIHIIARDIESIQELVAGARFRDWYQSAAVDYKSF